MSSPLPNDYVQYAASQFFDTPQVSKVEFFKMGAENTTALLEGNFGRVVLRVWGERHSRMGERQASDILDELDFMEACRAQRLPIPAVRTSLAGHIFETLPDGRKFGIMEYIKGEEPASFTQSMITELAQAVAAMNVLGQTYKYPAPRSFKGTIVDLAQERIETYRKNGGNDAFVEYLADRLEQGLSNIDLTAVPRGPIHGDIMYQNIKYTGERLSGIFDFDDCRESYFIEDITKTLFFAIEDPDHCVLGNDIANAKLFMKAYESVRPLSEAEKMALPVLSTARMVYELLKYHLHGAKHPQAAKILEAKKAAYQKFKPLFEANYLFP
jgi:homoserine kinase type II